MQFLKKILDFYIFSNIHVAVAGFCITKITMIKYGIDQSYTPIFVGLSIIISYNFIRFYEIKTGRLNWFKSWYFEHRKELIILSGIASVFLGYILFFTDFYLKSIFVLFPFAFMTLFYVVPLFKWRKVEFSFRNFPSIKIFSIAVAWAGICVFFPLYEAKIELSFDVYLDFFQRIALLIAITIPFDIRDITSDSKELKTLPQVLGIFATKLIGTYLLFFILILEYFKKTSSFSEILIWVFILGLTGIFLWFSTPKRTRFYTAFWVESIPIIWCIILFYFN